MILNVYYNDDKELQTEALANVNEAIEAVDKRLEELKKENALVKTLVA